jgi:hypothetical protein
MMKRETEVLDQVDLIRTPAEISEAAEILRDTRRALALLRDSPGGG